MDQTVEKRIVPISENDRKKLKKQGLSAIIFVSIFESICGVLFYNFMFPESFIIGIFFSFFFLFVGGFIVYGNIQKLLATEKEVLTGYITDKRVQHSKIRKSNNNHELYYIRLGNEEITVEATYYHQVAKGDKVMIERTPKSNQIFNIELLGNNSKNDLSEVKKWNISTPDRTISQSQNDKKVLRKKLFNLVLWRCIGIGLVSSFIYFFSALILILVVPKDTLPTFAYFYLPLISSLGIWIVVNIKTAKVFLDLLSDEKLQTTQTLKDVVRSNKEMTHIHTTITSSRIEKYMYLITEQNHFIPISNSIGYTLKKGDKITLFLSLNAKIILGLKVQE